MPPPPVPSSGSGSPLASRDKVLFITGYAENAVLGNGHLAPGMAVLTKPFGIDLMAARLRSMVEGGKERAKR